MKTFGNILWFIFGGFIGGILFFLLGIVFCCTLIGIPFGLKYLKLSKLCFCPFGKVVETNFDSHRFGNGLWLTLLGLLYAIIFFVIGLVLCCTLVLIPFGKQAFKIARFALAPFGSTVAVA